MKKLFLFLLITIYSPLLAMKFDIPSYALHFATVCNVLDDNHDDEDSNSPLFDFLKKAPKSIVHNLQEWCSRDKKHSSSNSKEIEEETFFIILAVSLLK